jgi:hypothetical protein
MDRTSEDERSAEGSSAGALRRNDSERRLRIRAFQFCVGLVPTLLLVVGNVVFVLNHFYAQAPHLLDSGWFSALVHRAGFIQVNPPIACNFARTYYGVHVSPFLSVFSVLSYAVPLERIEWFAVVEGAVYAPFGIVWYLVTSHVESAVPLVRIATSTLGAIAFCFSAQVLVCIGYPHFEVAVAGWTCVVLVSLVTGRRRLAWLAFVVALAVREDAGLHAGLALLPLLWLHRAHSAGGIRRTILVFVSLAFGCSLVAIAVQRLGFPAPTLLRAIYFGTPPLSHVGARFIVERLRFLVEHQSFLVVPFSVSMGLAVWRRDVGYLLGYVVTAPWFIVNLLAFDEGKGRFYAYTGFPFIVAFFWCLLYGVFLAPEARRIRLLRLEAIIGATCAASTIALWISAPWYVESTARSTFVTSAMQRTLVRGFSDRISNHRLEFGNLVVDGSVAALALEAVWSDVTYQPGATSLDTIAFHQDGVTPLLLPDLAALGLARCTHVIGTGLSVCGRDHLPPSMFSGLPTERIPPLLAFATTEPSGRRLAPQNGLVTMEMSPGLVFSTTSSGLAGDYEVVFRLDVAQAEPGEGELARVEVLVNGAPRAASVAKEARQHEVVLPFSLARTDWLGIRLWQRARASFQILDAEVRKVDR